MARCFWLYTADPSRSVRLSIEYLHKVVAASCFGNFFSAAFAVTEEPHATKQTDKLAAFAARQGILLSKNVEFYNNSQLAIAFLVQSYSFGAFNCVFCGRKTDKMVNNVKKIVNFRLFSTYPLDFCTLQDYTCIECN